MLGRKPLKNFGIRLTETLQLLVTEKEKETILRDSEKSGVSVNQWLRGAIFMRNEVEKMKIEKTAIKGEL